MKPIGELNFDEGNTSETFELADGHKYTLHRIQLEGKPTQYALLGLDTGATGAFTPYIREEQMARVLALRMGQERKVDAVPDSVSPTGFTCPGCGAIVTETGAHVGTPESAEATIKRLEGKLETPATPSRRSRFVR